MREFFMGLVGMSDALGDRDPGDDFWFAEIGMGTQSGVKVSEARALQSAAVYGCVRVLAETIGMLPFSVFHRDENDNATRVRDHVVTGLLGRKANERMTATEFTNSRVASLVLRGNAYSEIVLRPDFEIGALEPLHVDQVTPVRAGRRVEYKVRENPQPGASIQVLERSLPHEAVWHLRGLQMGGDGITGLDPISIEKEAIGGALAQQDYGNRFWKNDARPRGIIRHPNHFKDEEARDRFLGGWRRGQSGGRMHSHAVLEYGMEYQSIGLDHQQSEFLAARRYSDVEIARIFRVPPHKIGILDRATFSNIEHQALEFVTETLLPWLVNLEQSIAVNLLGDDEALDHFVKFNVEGLLRGDLLTRYRAYAIARNWGWLSANDVRVLEDMNKIEDGDIYLQPTNMMPADTPAEPSGQGRPTFDDDRDRDEDRDDDEAADGGLRVIAGTEGD